MSQNNSVPFLLELFEAHTKFTILFLLALKRQSFHGQSPPYVFMACRQYISYK
ncbi:hypothetical protein ACFTAO_48255 [Paenibacillus rhizoplanae]